MSDRIYIVIKGSDWLFSRLNELGITDKEKQKRIMKSIWTGKSCDRKLLNDIRRCYHEKREDTFYY